MPASILNYRPEIKLEIAGNDVTQYLGDQGTVSLRKSIMAPAGEFAISFPDMPTPNYRESLYGLVRPLDDIVISGRRWQEPETSLPEWTVMLRGFVRSIGRDEQIAQDGRPQRRVVISGHDCGAVFSMEMLAAYITYQNQANGEGILPAPLVWLREYGLISQPFPVQTFIWLLAFISTQEIMRLGGFSFVPVLAVDKGAVLPHTAFSQEGPIWGMLKRYSDAPWNELFVREGEKEPELVFRPAPYYETPDQDDKEAVAEGGKPLPDAEVGLKSVRFWEIPNRNVIALHAHRDDSELVNHAWVMLAAGNVGGNTCPIINQKGTLNADTRAKFGDRLATETTYLGPTNLAPSINLNRAAQIAADQEWCAWGAYRLEWLKLAGKNIHLLERGSLTIKGDPKIQVGDYIWVTRGDLRWRGYVVNIQHQFSAYRHYLTTLDYIRGTQWLVRKTIDKPWDSERKSEGASAIF